MRLNLKNDARKVITVVSSMTVCLIIAPLIASQPGSFVKDNSPYSRQGARSKPSHQKKKAVVTVTNTVPDDTNNVPGGTNTVPGGTNTVPEGTNAVPGNPAHPPNFNSTNHGQAPHTNSGHANTNRPVKHK